MASSNLSCPTPTLSTSLTGPVKESLAVNSLPRTLIFSGFCVPEHPRPDKSKGARVWIFEEKDVVHKVTFPGSGRWPSLSELPSNPLDPRLFLPVYRADWLRYDSANKSLPQSFTKYPRYICDYDPQRVAAESLRDIAVNEHIRTHLKYPEDFAHLYRYLGCDINQQGFVSSIKFERLPLTLQDDLQDRRPIDWVQVSDHITKAIHLLASIGLIYTDFRSDNIVRTKEHVWKLIDFGYCLLIKGEDEEAKKEIVEGVENASERLREIVNDQCHQ